MKNLRHMLRPTQWFGSSKRRQRPHDKQSKQRRLRSEALEKRELLAGDLLRPDVNPHHNGLSGVDANADGWVTPGDILVVLNALAEKQTLGGAAQGESQEPIEFKVDVNNDLELTPADALMVINDLNENGPHAMDPIVEFTLNARDLDDNLIAPDATGNIAVDVNQIFQLEVGYNDLRGLGAAGVFTQFLNLQTGQDLNANGNVVASEGDDVDSGVLTPVLTEFQELAFDQALNDNSLSGSYTFSQEGNATEFTISRSDLVGNPEGSVGDALEAFGYDASEFNVTLVLPTSSTAPFRFQIQYTDFANPNFLNVDLPNISVADNLTDASGNAAEGDVTSFSVSPVNSDGSINGDAIPFNIDFRNRFFNNQDVYGFNPEGDFNESAGYIAVGATLEGASLSVPEKIGRSLPTNEPMESYSVRVFLDSSVTAADPINVGIEIPDPTTEKNEYLLLFREQGRVDESLVTLGADSRVSLVTTGVAVNTPPVIVGGGLTRMFSESDATATLNLTDGVTDADGDTLNVDPATVSVSGDTSSGTTRNGNIVTINPAAYAALNTGESATITYSYNVIDGNGGSVPHMATITINGVDTANTAPSPGAPVTAMFTEDDNPGTVNLLANATDADDDNLSIVTGSVSLNAGGDNRGITIDEANGILNVTPQAYGDILDDGEQAQATYSFMITDGNGGTVSSSATVTITGITDVVGNSNPVVQTTPLAVSFSEDDSDTTSTFDLLTGASDPDAGDMLSVSGFQITSANSAGVTRVGNSLNVTPSEYNSLAVNTTNTVTATYSIIDGNGGTVSQAVTVTFNGANDAPIVAGEVSQTFNESDSTTSVSLLTGASDVDTGDVLSVVAGASLSGDTQGVSISGNNLVVNPSAYASLNTGETATATVNYTITDNNGGNVSQVATITINGEGNAGGGNNAPTVGDALSETFSENDPTQTVNLIQGAVDADGDAFNVTINGVTGSTAGATVSGTTLTIDPSAYSSLDTGETEQIVYSYTISDGNGGSVAQTATINITGVDDVINNNAPTVQDPVTATFSEDAANGTVNLLSGASDADGDALTVQNLVATGNDVGITVNGNTLTVNPSAYGGLADGETAVISYTYNISDGNGGVVAQTATITINGADEVTGDGSTISGQVFEDRINNIEEVIRGATPIRDGVRGPGEPAYAGVTVTLTPSTGSARSTSTDLQGNYSFANVPAGAYTIDYTLPSGVMVNGDTSFTGTSSGSGAIPGPVVSIIGVQGAISNMDILASSYLAGNEDMSAMSNGGIQGGSALLDAAGNQELFIAGLGLDGVRFAELSMNESQDAALLTVLEDDGDIRSARLSEDQFVVSRDGTAVQFFGGLEDFVFVDLTEAELSQEFATYRNAIDEVLSQGV
jgi:VCBS repeat-containing protein